MKTTFHTLTYFIKNIYILLGLVLIWRGTWYVLDEIDVLFFGNHILSSVGGIILGLIILYIPDHDLKEISNL